MDKTLALKKKKGLQICLGIKFGKVLGYKMWIFEK